MKMIDADALVEDLRGRIKLLHEYYDKTKDKKSKGILESELLTFTELILTIKDMPKAVDNDSVEWLDPARWLKPENASAKSVRFKCSYCGGIAYYIHGNHNRRYGTKERKCEYRFCPNCGSNMEV